MVFTTTDNRTVDVFYNLVSGEENGVKVVKAYKKLEAYITISGRPGKYLVREEVDKNHIENAFLVDSRDMIITNPDTVFEWFVDLNGDHATVSYQVKRGVIPPSLPTVRLATCDMKVSDVKSEFLSGGSERVILLRFSILLNGERVLPTNITVRTDNGRAQVSILKDSRSFQALIPVERGLKELKAYIEAGSGSCKIKYPVKVSIPQSEYISLYLWIGALLFVLILVVLYLLLKKTEG